MRLTLHTKRICKNHDLNAASTLYSPGPGLSLALFITTSKKDGACRETKKSTPARSKILLSLNRPAFCLFFHQLPTKCLPLYRNQLDQVCLRLHAKKLSVSLLAIDLSHIIGDLASTNFPVKTLRKKIRFLSFPEHNNFLHK